ncbi:TPA: hypothetical protein ACT1UX_005013, partial [Raoultella planticola]
TRAMLSAFPAGGVNALAGLRINNRLWFCRPGKAQYFISGSVLRVAILCGRLPGGAALTGATGPGLCSLLSRLAA